MQPFKLARTAGIEPAHGVLETLSPALEHWHVFKLVPDKRIELLSEE